MEEDNDEITGWGDNQVNILDNKLTKKRKKKMTHSTLVEEYSIQRKLKPSYTLPYIKNKRTIDDTTIQIPSRKQIQPLDDRITKLGEVIGLKQDIKEQTMEYPLQYGSNQREKQQSDRIRMQNEQTYSIQKRMRQVKHGSTILKGQKISNIQKLKIEAVEYSSTPRNNSITDKQKTELLKKISKSSLANNRNKQKSKYFIVKKERLSPQQASQEVSKIAIQSRKSSGQQKVLISEEKKSYVMNQKYKDIIKTVQIGRKNSITLLKSQSQQLKSVSHVRRNTNVEFNLSTNKKDIKITASNKDSFQQCVGVRQEESNIKKSNKWDKVLKEVQNESKTLKKLMELQKKISKAALQSKFSQLPNYNHKARNMAMMLTKKLKNASQTTGPKMIKNLKKNLLTQISKGQQSYSKNKKTKATDQQSLRYDEFNDECLFYNRSQKSEGHETSSH